VGSCLVACLEHFLHLLAPSVVASYVAGSFVVVAVASAEGCWPLHQRNVSILCG
jgi:hypothetical protein